MRKMRLLFQKTGRAIYLSHLDLMRVFQTAFTRAEVPLWFTEGFNPHPYISPITPLPVGVASEYELLDFNTEAEFDLQAACVRLSERLPEGLLVSEMYEAVLAPKQLCKASYTIRISSDNSEALAARCLALFAQDSVFVQKRTKSGDKMIDIKPQIFALSVVSEAEAIVVELMAALSGESVFNPLIFVKALEISEEQLYSVTKTALYAKDGSVFR